MIRIIYLKIIIYQISIFLLCLCFEEKQNKARRVWRKAALLLKAQWLWQNSWFIRGLDRKTMEIWPSTLLWRRCHMRRTLRIQAQCPHSRHKRRWLMEILLLACMRKSEWKRSWLGLFLEPLVVCFFYISYQEHKALQQQHSTSSESLDDAAVERYVRFILLYFKCLFFSHYLFACNTKTTTLQSLISPLCKPWPMSHLNII